jgi:UDP:flavonoid glycosyltransferase YjiC (YdhE family)
MAEDLLPVARDWDPDVMIHEPAELAAPLVAAAVAVPTVTHAYGTAVPRRFLAAAAVRLRPLWAAHGVSTPPLAAMLRATYADICPPSMQPRLPTHARRVLLRPVPYSGAAAWTDDLEASALPLVYVTLGTVYSNADTLTRAAAGLHDLPVRAVVTVGPGRDPGELGYQPAQVRVVRWVPQAAIVPLSSVVVSHCGSGTFLTALAHGKPQLALPQSADQFRNAKALVRRGAGLALLPGGVNPQAVASAVQRLLHEEHFAAAARDVAAEISAMPAPDVVVSTLENSYPSKVRK